MGQVHVVYSSVADNFLYRRYNDFGWGGFHENDLELFRTVPNNIVYDPKNMLIKLIHCYANYYYNAYGLHNDDHGIFFIPSTTLDFSKSISLGDCL